MHLKKLIKFFLNNYFISIFLVCILFVGIVSGYKLFYPKSTYVYAKVKIGQGLWWASYSRPNIWFIKSLKIGERENDLLGKPVAQILKITYFPYFSLLTTGPQFNNQYDIYVTLKLKVSGNKKTEAFNFKRSTVGVGSPVEFEFPTVQFSGTITEFSTNPIKDKLIEKTIILSKQNAQPWEYDAIKLGDIYFDGQHNLVTIIDKKSADNSKSLTVTVKALVQKTLNNDLILGEEQILTVGNSLNIKTTNFTFDQYMVTGIE